MTLKSLIHPFVRNWPLTAVLSSMLMLAIAHGFERFGHMAPCVLCLHQREVYWIAIAIGLIALVSRKMASDSMSIQALNLLLAIAFGAGTLVAGFHMGVEYKWWPGLASCAAGAVQAPGDILAALGKPMQAPACDQVAWSLLGLSMAGWNMVISLKLCVYSVIAAWRPYGFKELAVV
jgi:disulfide bond formation protein DsbB